MKAFISDAYAYVTADVASLQNSTTISQYAIGNATHASTKANDANTAATAAIGWYYLLFAPRVAFPTLLVDAALFAQSHVAGAVANASMALSAAVAAETAAYAANATVLQAQNTGYVGVLTANDAASTATAAYNRANTAYMQVLQL